MDIRYLVLAGLLVFGCLVIPSEGDSAEVATDALSDAFNAISLAIDEGRTDGLEEANSRYDAGLHAYENGDYASATHQAQLAEELAVAATVPIPTPNPAEDAFAALEEAFDALNTAADEGRTEGWEEAYDVYYAGLVQYNASNYTGAMELAHQAHAMADATTTG